MELSRKLMNFLFFVMLMLLSSCSPLLEDRVFSGNKSIEEILVRYVNLPEQERGRLKNKEFLQKAIGKIRNYQNDQETSPTVSTDSQIEMQEIQQEIVKSRIRLVDMEKRLRVFEGDISDIKTLCEAEYREHVLDETLKQVQMRKA